jgi:L-rhamnose mutarotase
MAIAMERVCFLLKVREERIAEYKQRHAEVWPEMLNALAEAGWHNYSLFLRGDGLLVGYCEVESFTKVLENMKHFPVNEKWQEWMAPFFEGFGTGKADDNMIRLEEVFHLA